ncbi:MAG: septum formation initiator family protein [Pseudomonadota bacterium]
MFRFRFLVEIAAPVLILCWAAISVYAAAAGQSGYGALSALEREVASKQEEVDALKARRLALEKHADLLSSRSLDPDYADERIRGILGYAREGDVVITREELERALAEGRRRSN